MLDIDRILRTEIPDIAPIYGGVRGRTMSSHHQSFAWPDIVEAGVKTVIDLRDQDSSDRLPGLCARYGLEYFRYPVNKDLSSIDKMIELLPTFCEKIDNGDFYLACAMGLHRTDIALCVYWVFYAADRGVEPPKIRGYRAEDGHKTDSIMKVLNAIFRYMANKNGYEPMPLALFKERKKVIEKNAG